MASQEPISVDPPAAPTTAPATKPKSLNLSNIQGDILAGLPKKTETFYFFQITKSTAFRHHFRDFIPLIKTAADVADDRLAIEKHKADCKAHPGQNKPVLIPLVGVNVAFSHFGFKKLEIEDTKLADTAFLSGQRVDAGKNLNDKGTGSGDDFVPDWEDAFKEEIHGAIIVAGDSHSSVDKKLREIERIFHVGADGASIVKVTSVRGDARPGTQSAHEHFGYLDGVSNPAINGVDTKPPPGPASVDPGVLLLDEDGDELKGQRDAWMADGSFLVFRYLFQKVPEFDDFLERNALPAPTTKQGADLLGARLVGRWKSGAPVDITPFEDDENLGGDPERNNDFHFKAERNFQKMCPFAAHVRKTLPRADLEDLPLPPTIASLSKRRIMRRGIQFGPEVTKQEKAEKKTIHGRGLLFACYQSSIINGFQFIQQSWANNPTFPPEQTPEVPGFDPIIGQAPQGGARKLSGFDPANPSVELELDNVWVVPRGGEYFFSPSIKGLSDKIAAT